MKLKNLASVTVMLSLATFTLFASKPVLAASSAPTVAVVNYERLVTESKYYQDGANAFKTRFEEREKELAVLSEQLTTEDKALRDLKEKLDRDVQAGKLSGKQLQSRESELQKRAADFEKKVEDFRTKQAALQKDEEEFQNSELARVQQIIAEIVKKYATEKGIQIIIDSKAAIYSATAVDVTTDLLSKVK